MKCPCRDCPDRKMNCHSECEKYKEYAKENAKRREAKNKAKEEQWQIYRRGK